MKNIASFSHAQSNGGDGSCSVMDVIRYHHKKKTHSDVSNLHQTGNGEFLSGMPLQTAKTTDQRTTASQVIAASMLDKEQLE